ncbi:MULTISPECIES: competence protein CoiA [Thalassospira]|uniref:Competence protein CoiA family protein n=1 Tax=Thalassospira aquimaris TaxID=3037796 RepID=A0ABT6GIF0_9PROT|nr:MULTISPECIES: competence protein CoiA family protein [Thalassospira]MDG4721800.1 competence protein CoiA family protein [Thalassospira sp. FZY0004]
MKLQFAIVEGIRKLPSKGSLGKCPNCGEIVISKCGNQRVHHWAHKSTRVCDTWWENETQWHIEWKNHFPQDWHEISQSDQSGQRHIADVKRPDGFVVEFQHSHISEDEREQREAFYGRMVWVIDALRLKRSTPCFQKAIRTARLICQNPIVLQVDDTSALIKRWITSKKVVYFDFGNHQITSEKLPQYNSPMIWRLDPSSTIYRAHLTPLPKSQLVADIRTCQMTQPSKSGLFEHIRLKTQRPLSHAPKTTTGKPLKEFERYLAAKRRRRAAIRL